MDRARTGGDTQLWDAIAEATAMLREFAARIIIGREHGEAFSLAAGAQRAGARRRAARRRRGDASARPPEIPPIETYRYSFQLSSF